MLKIRNENKIATCSTVSSPSTESNLFGGTATTPSTGTGLFGTAAKAADTVLFESTASTFGKQQQPFGANVSTVSSTKTPSESGNFGANQSTIEPKDDQTSSEHKIIFFLPPKRIVSTDGDTLSLFFTNKFVFSNHFPSDFTFMGITYSCCEQFYMRFKCNYFNDTLRAATIMIIKDPKQMKQEGKKVDGFVADQWNKIKLKVMKLAVFCKFTQNSKLLLELFKTIDSTLVETSGDLYWGVGLSIDDANVANKNCWRGNNHLGYILTDLRKFLQFKPVYVKLVKEAYEFLKMKVPDYCYAKQIPQSFSPPEINMIEEWLDDNILNSNDGFGSKLLQVMNHIEGRGLGKCNNGITEPIINPYRHPSDRSGFGLHGKEPSKIQYEQFKKQRSQSRVFTTPSAHLVLRGNPAHLDSGDRRIGCSRGRTFYNSRILHGGSSHEERDQTQVPHDYGTQKPSGGRNTEAETKQNLEHADEPDEIQRIKKELEDFKRDFQNSQETIRNLQQQVNELHNAQRVAQEKELLLHDHTEKNNTFEHKRENVTSELEQARIESGNTKFLISQFENMS